MQWLLLIKILCVNLPSTVYQCTCGQFSLKASTDVNRKAIIFQGKYEAGKRAFPCSFSLPVSSPVVGLAPAQPLVWDMNQVTRKTLKPLLQF